MTEAWYDTAFRAPYELLYRHRTDAAASAEVGWVLGELCLVPGSAVLDLGCGNGRHTRALAAAGMRVAGVDRSPDLLRRAAACAAGAERSAGRQWFARADMRALPLRDSAVDAVTSFFTSFGYFETDVEDRAVVAEVRRVLRPGGAYLLDFLNAASVRATLEAESREECQGWSILQRRRLADGQRRVEKEVSIAGPAGQELHYTESVRLYSADELDAVLASVGFVERRRFGALDGTPWSESSPRSVLLARAPGESATHSSRSRDPRR